MKIMIKKVATVLLLMSITCVANAAEYNYVYAIAGLKNLSNKVVRVVYLGNTNSQDVRFQRPLSGSDTFAPGESSYFKEFAALPNLKLLHANPKIYKELTGCDAPELKVAASLVQVAITGWSDSLFDEGTWTQYCTTHQRFAIQLMNTSGKWYSTHYIAVGDAGIWATKDGGAGKDRYLISRDWRYTDIEGQVVSALRLDGKVRLLALRVTKAGDIQMIYPRQL